MAGVELTNEQWRVVITAVVRLPWEIANPIMLQICKQLDAQNNNKEMQETAAAQGETRVRQ